MTNVGFDAEALIKTAGKAMENAYAPYSGFRVGAALLAEDGRIFTGCNVENASYGACNCAERTAVFKAVSEGARKFTAIAVVCSAGTYAYPCGICRQVLSEFGTDITVILNDKDKGLYMKKLCELLPDSFSLEN